MKCLRPKKNKQQQQHENENPEKVEQWKTSRHKNYLIQRTRFKYDDR